MSQLLRDPTARRRWTDRLENRGFRVSARNVAGYPFDPDRDKARLHDRDLRNAVRIAALLEVNRDAMAGCPPGAQGDRTAHFDAGGWSPYLAGVHERQWDDALVPYSSEVAEFALAEHPELAICIELHPGTCVYNVESFERFAEIAPNLDPSHLFWQQMDPPSRSLAPFPVSGTPTRRTSYSTLVRSHSTACSIGAGRRPRQAAPGRSRPSAAATRPTGGARS